MLADTVAQLYGNYDTACADLVHLLKYPYPAVTGKPILHVFATPERAFAQAERKLRTRPDNAQRSFVLPWASVERVSETFDITRAHRATIPDVYYVSEARTRYLGMPYPLPMTLTYQISLWAKQIDDINRLVVQWYLLFDHTPRRYLTVDHPSPMGPRIVHAITTEVTQPPMIPEPEKQRLIRRVVTLVVDGWISRASFETGIVERVIVDFWDTDDLVTETDRLGRVEVTEDGRVD